jgi:endonuclease/exonuclease/phosphatase family metal-dependent hydrolase
VPELSVASFNVHWGRGGRRGGYRLFDIVAACHRIDADVLALQETWAPDGEAAQHQEVADALGYHVAAVPLARAELDPKPRILSRADPERTEGDGDFCLAVLSRRPIVRSHVVPLPPLWFDPWGRALLQAEVDLGGTSFTVVATHFSHLEFGSPLQAPALRRGLPPADQPAALLGDMNMWGWTISAMVPKRWRRAVQGPTWPAPRPHHQIDHILVTPAVEVLESSVLPDLGSDHRPVRARLGLP